MQKKIEERILGTALAYDNANMHLNEIITTEDAFTNDINRGFYRALRETFDQGLTHDPILITNRAKKHLKDVPENEVDVAMLSFTMEAQVPSAMPALCVALIEDFVKRAVNDYGFRMSAYAKDVTISPEALLDAANKEIQDIEDKIGGDIQETIVEQVSRTVSQLKAASENKGLVGEETGLSDFDQKTGGYQRGHLITIAGRPAMGKSALMLKTVVHLCQRGIPCLVFSREMTSEEIVKRAHCVSGGSFNMEDLFVRGLTKEQVPVFEMQSQNIAEWPLTIDEKSHNLTQVIFEIKRFAKKHPNGLVFIDYIQLLNGYADRPYTGETSKLTDITRGLKQTAKHCDIPIIQLSQLNRDVENRPNKLPQLSDLKQSGSIEEDSNLVVFCYRPEYYHIENFPDGQDSAGLCDLLIAKNRSGSTGFSRVRYTGVRVLFEDFENFSNVTKSSKELVDYSAPQSADNEDLPY